MIKEFRTKIEPLKYRGLIDHRQPVLFLGSCFSDNIGIRLQRALFNVEINPFGTLYNPASIACGIDDILQCREFTINDLFKIEGDNRWHSFGLHSSYSSVSSDVMLGNINHKIFNAHELLKRSSSVIVTFGTAWIYLNSETSKVVANCHKLPASSFIRKMMNVDDIVKMWTEIIDKIRTFNNQIQVIFTVSPIRHLRDGAHENQLSKSVLHLAINELKQRHQGIVYFPAYEIMNDDLRDYRFYSADMTHPSDVAVDYIYDIFSQSFFDEKTIEISTECERFTRRLSHRIMNDDDVAIAKFRSSTEELKNKLLHQYPFLENAILKYQ